MKNFFLGLGVGLIGGVLLAPKSGTETREYLGEKTDDGLKYLKTRANDLTGAASDLVAQGKATASEFADKTKTMASGALDKGKAAAADAFGKGKQALQSDPDVNAMRDRVTVQRS